MNRIQLADWEKALARSGTKWPAQSRGIIPERSVWICLPFKQIETVNPDNFESFLEMLIGFGATGLMVTVPFWALSEKRSKTITALLKLQILNIGIAVVFEEELFETEYGSELLMQLLGTLNLPLFVQLTERQIFSVESCPLPKEANSHNKQQGIGHSTVQIVKSMSTCVGVSSAEFRKPSSAIVDQHVSKFAFGESEYIFPSQLAGTLDFAHQETQASLVIACRGAFGIRSATSEKQGELIQQMAQSPFRTFRFSHNPLLELAAQLLHKNKTVFKLARRIFIVIFVRESK